MSFSSRSWIGCKNIATHSNRRIISPSIYLLLQLHSNRTVQSYTLCVELD